jgi:hypothetical protein
MSRVTRTRATTAEEKKIGCDWKTCANKAHEKKQDYINNGFTEREPHLDENWVAPWDEPKNSNRTAHETITEHKFQRHHVIPINVIRDLLDLGHNLRLIGWDINNYTLNGISLPKYNSDMHWHKLPVHRGSHKSYDKVIKRQLKAIHDSDWVNLCGPEENQEKLFDEIVEIADIIQMCLRDNDPAYQLCFTVINKS